jgi:hypothetical protein
MSEAGMVPHRVRRVPRTLSQELLPPACVRRIVLCDKNFPMWCKVTEALADSDRATSASSTPTVPAAEQHHTSVCHLSAERGAQSWVAEPTSCQCGLGRSRLHACVRACVRARVCV